MIFQIRIMKPAQTDIREIHRYISDELHNPSAAARRISLIDKAIQSLKQNPARFPLVKDRYLASIGFRMTIVKSHLVFFTINEDESIVSIMRVLYARRDWVRLLKIDSENQSEIDTQ